MEESVKRKGCNRQAQGKRLHEKAKRSRETGMKVCTRCEQDKPLTEYTKDNSHVDGRKSKCRECANAVRMDWVKRNPEKTNLSKRSEYERNREKYLAYNKSDARRARAFKWKLETHYGISVEDFDEMLERQDGRCAICHRTPEEVPRHKHKHRLCIDHCHATGVVRGLLCVSCNAGLGNYGDSPDMLKSAARYLETSGASHAKEQNSLASDFSPDVCGEQHGHIAHLAHGGMAHQDHRPPENRREVHQPYSRDHSAAAV